MSFGARGGIDEFVRRLLAANPESVLPSQQPSTDPATAALESYMQSSGRGGGPAGLPSTPSVQVLPPEQVPVPPPAAPNLTPAQLYSITNLGGRLPQTDYEKRQGLPAGTLLNLPQPTKPEGFFGTVGNIIGAAVPDSPSDLFSLPSRQDLGDALFSKPSTPFVPAAVQHVLTEGLKSAGAAGYDYLTGGGIGPDIGDLPGGLMGLPGAALGAAQAVPGALLQQAKETATHPWRETKQGFGAFLDNPAFTYPQSLLTGEIGDIQYQLANGNYNQDVLDRAESFGPIGLQFFAPVLDPSIREDALRGGGGNGTYQAVQTASMQRLPAPAAMVLAIEQGITTDPWMAFTEVGSGIRALRTTAETMEQVSRINRFAEGLTAAERAKYLKGKALGDLTASERAVAAGRAEAAGIAADPGIVAKANKYRAAAEMMERGKQVVELPETVVFRGGKRAATLARDWIPGGDTVARSLSKFSEDTARTVYEAVRGDENKAAREFGRAVKETGAVGADRLAREAEGAVPAAPPPTTTAETAAEVAATPSPQLQRFVADGDNILIEYSDRSRKVFRTAASPEAANREAASMNLALPPRAIGPNAVPAPAVDLDYLGPTPNRRRVVDQAATVLSQDDPDAYRAFLAAYTPGADRELLRQQALDVKHGPRFTLAKDWENRVGEIEHLVDDLAPAWIDATGSNPALVPSKGIRSNATTALVQKYVFTRDPTIARGIRDELERRAYKLAKNGERMVTKTGKELVKNKELAADLARIDAARDRYIGRLLPEARAPRNPAEATAAGIPPTNVPTGTPPAFALEPAIEDLASEDSIRAFYSKGAISRDSYELLSQPVLRKVTMPDGTTEEIESSIAQAVADHLGSGKGIEEAADALEAEIRAAGGPPPSWLGERQGKGWRRFRNGLRVYDGLTRAVKEKAQFGPLTGWRAVAGNQIGNTLTLFTQGQFDAARRLWSPEIQRAAFSDARDLSSRALAQTDGGQFWDRLGVTQSRIRPALEGEVLQPGLTMQRYIANKTGSQQVGKIAGGMFGMESMKNLHSAGDMTLRTVVRDEVGMRNLPAIREQFQRHLGGEAERLGLGHDQTHALVDGLGEQFAPGDVWRLATDAGFTPGQADQLARNWRGRVGELEGLADSEMNRIAFKPGSKNADEVARRMFLYTFWMSRASPLYLRAALRNPALLNAGNRLMTDLRKDCESRSGQDCGFLEMWDHAGFSTLFNPAYLASTAILNLEPEQWQNPDNRLLDRVLGKVPSPVTPLLGAAFSHLGWSNRIGQDPLMTGNERNLIRNVVNMARGKGWIGEQTPATDPAVPFLEKLQAGTASWLAEHNVPFSEVPDVIDHNATEKQMLKARGVELISAKYDIPLGTPIEAWPDAAQGDLSVMLDAADHGKTSSPYYNQAFGDLYGGNTLGMTAMRLANQSPSRLRSNAMQQLRALRDQPGSSTRGEGAQDMLQLIAAGDPLESQLKLAQAQERGPLVQQRADQTLGSAAAVERLIAQRQADPVGTQAMINAGRAGAPGTESKAGEAWRWYNTIRYDDSPPPIEIGDQTLAPEVIAALPDDDPTAPLDRKRLAETWIAERGLGEDLITFQEGRTNYREELAPEVYQAYTQWASDVRDMGVESYRNSEMEGNPMYADYIAGLPPELTDNPDALDAASTSIDAYLAATGHVSGLYAPHNLGASSSDAPFNALPAGGAGAGGAAPVGFAKSVSEQITADAAKYQMDEAFFNQLLVQETGNPNASLDLMNPMLRSAYEADFAARGISVPSVPRSLERYQLWAAQQQPGQPTDLSAYQAFVNQVEAGLLGSNISTNDALDVLLGGMPMPAQSSVPDLLEASYAPGGSVADLLERGR